MSPRTTVKYDIYKNAGEFAIRVEEGFVSLAGAKASMKAVKYERPGTYFVRKVETTDFSESDLGLQ